MNKLLTILATTLLTLIATPNKAEAGVKIGSSYTYVSGRSHCGCPIYTKRVVSGFSSYRKPIYSYYRLPSRCNCQKKLTSTAARRISAARNNSTAARHISATRNNNAASRHISSVRGTSTTRNRGASSSRIRSNIR